MERIYELSFPSSFRKYCQANVYSEHRLAVFQMSVYVCSFLEPGEAVILQMQMIGLNWI